MQDRYAGDIGDFGKFAVLHALAQGRKLGVCWYRCSGAGERNNDGKHTAYLQQHGRFRHLDPGAFDAMKQVAAIAAGARGLRPTARSHLPRRGSSQP